MARFKRRSGRYKSRKRRGRNKNQFVTISRGGIRL